VKEKVGKEKERDRVLERIGERGGKERDRLLGRKGERDSMKKERVSEKEIDR